MKYRNLWVQAIVGTYVGPQWTRLAANAITLLGMTYRQVARAMECPNRRLINPFNGSSCAANRVWRRNPQPLEPSLLAHWIR